MMVSVSNQRDHSQGNIAESYATGYVLARALYDWYLRDLVIRIFRSRVRGLKGLSAAVSEATDSMEAFASALGPIDDEIDQAFTEIVEAERKDGA